MAFDSHVLTLVAVAARLVNELTPGHRGGQLRDAPTGDDLTQATARALGGQGRITPEVTAREAEALARYAIEMRQAFRAVHEGDLVGAVTTLNALLAETGARPQLDQLSDGSGWHVHFHGSDDTLATGWGAGCATGLALALGSNLAGRLGICDADRCDRVYVDTSKNGSRRYCAITCQNRTKAAAHRARN